MRARVLAATLAMALLAGSTGVGAGSPTPVRPVNPNAYTQGAGDSSWAPSTFPLQTVQDPGVAPLSAVPQSGSTSQTRPATPSPRPPEPTQVWRWAEQVCITTRGYNGMLDANQWQTCEGSACPQLPEGGRGCYAAFNPYSGATTSQPVGSIADTNTCVAMTLSKNGWACGR